MTTVSESRSDRAIGYSVLFGLLAVGGAIAMVAGPGQPLAAWGFAVAMLAGTVLVLVVHLSGETTGNRY